VSFLHSGPNEPDSGATKFVVLAVAILIALGGVAFWFLRNAPEPTVPSERTAPPAVVEEEAPAEAAPAPKSRTEDLAKTGALAVAANVEGASVYVDGALVGEAPYETGEIAVGRHEIRVEKDGYEPFRDDIRVRPGARAELNARLVVLAPSLRVVSDVPGATVFLDRNYVGTTPVDIKDVKPGEHQLTVSADGYDMYAETLNVTSGHRDVQVSFKNVTLAERIPVVHKHRMGSCEGTLIADNNGLRYETSNKNDAFAVPFSELEQFEVDYIEKNLNLKIRKGRNYNFTERSGNADPLFVFHKNVQAFRESS
jgi:hypothetical protein